MIDVSEILRRVKSDAKKRKISKDHLQVYKKYQASTMISVLNYISNLELALSIREVQGAIVECGTWKGGMIAGIADVLGPNRSYYLYDSFEGLPDVQAIDGKAAIEWQSNTDSPNFFNNCSASYMDAKRSMEMSLAKQVHIHKGWFHETLVNKQLPDQIALLRLDGDWYDSTLTCLNHLFHLVVNNGLIIVDDYYTWDGCSRAVHDFLSSNARIERIDKHGSVCVIKKR